MNSLFARIADWSHRNMPTREQMERNRFVPNRVLRTDLWRFTRRSVPRGVALGMLVGILLPFAQIVFAALFSLPARANVPVAAATTFITNPFTTPLIWALSYNVGASMMNFDSHVLAGPLETLARVTDFWTLLQWVTAEGKVLAFGLLVVAVVSASVSYLLAGLTWRWWIVHKRRRTTSR